MKTIERSRLLPLAFAALAAAALATGCSGSRKPDKLTEELLSTPKEALFE